jgi:hypothetical protein
LNGGRADLDEATVDYELDSFDRHTRLDYEFSIDFVNKMGGTHLGDIGSYYDLAGAAVGRFEHS